MRVNGVRINEERLNYATPPSGVSLPSLSPATVPGWRLEARSASGTLLWRVLDWYDAEIEERINEPWTLRGSYDIDSGTQGVQSGEYFPHLWLFRAGETSPYQKFIVTKTTEEIRTSTVVRFDAVSSMGKLAWDIVDSYTTEDGDDLHSEDADKKSIGGIISDLLALQTASPAIARGTIDSAFASEIIKLTVNQESILSVLYKLRQQYGGYLWVDTSNRLQWRMRTGYDAGHLLSLSKNAVSVSVHKDRGEVITRMIGLGKGVTDDTRLKVTVNDTTAQATYGIRVGTFSDPSIDDVDALTKAATAALKRANVIRARYEVEAIDVSRAMAEAGPFDSALFTLGTRVRLKDVDGAPVCRIVGIRRALDNPTDVSITLSDPSAGGDRTPDTGNDPANADVSSVSEWMASVEERLRDLQRDTGVFDSIRAAINDGESENDWADVDDIVTWDEARDVGTLPDAFIDALDDSQDLRDALEDFLSSNSATITYFAQVESVQNDYVTCLRYNPVTDTTSAEIKVAKPYNLRRTPFDTETITYIDGQAIEYQYLDDSERTATDINSLDSESQVVTPRYYVGEVIRIVYGDTGLVDGSSAAILWEDLNTAGRVWAKV